MKPIKPKPLSGRMLDRLQTLAISGGFASFDSKDARAIIAALEHAKQPAPLYQCRRKCACMFSTTERRDRHEEKCG